MNDFVIADPAKCIGCRTCEVACVLAHKKDIGVSGLTVENFDSRLKVVTTAKVTTPIQCRQCEDAPCIKSCVRGVLTQREHSVQINSSACIGCKSCLLACPYGAIELAVTTQEGARAVEVVKCDLCRGNETGPACIKVCPTKALKEIKNKKFSAQIVDKRKHAAAFIQG